MTNIQTIKKIFTTGLAALALLLVPVLTVSSAYAAASITNCLIDGTELKGTVGTDCSGTQGGNASEDSLTNAIALIVNIISVIVGVIAVIMIIFGGAKYITSGGESAKITSAKNTLMYAIIGLIVVALAQFIVRFVLKNVSKVA